MTFGIFGSKADAAAYLNFSSKSPKARAVRQPRLLCRTAGTILLRPLNFRITPPLHSSLVTGPCTHFHGPSKVPDRSLAAD
jgi:hypothetical protein